MVHVSGRTLEFGIPLRSGESQHFRGTIEAISMRGSVAGLPVEGTFALFAGDPFPAEKPPAPDPDTMRTDLAALASAVARIERTAPDVRALLVMRNGQLVAEKYFHGAQAGDAFNTRSVTKSILSAAIGVALQRGMFRDLDERLIDVFPERAARMDDDRRKNITLRHLATMTAGLHWRENDRTTTDWIASRDWVEFALALRQEEEPGKVFNYSTALSHLLSAALSRRAGMPTRRYVEENVLHPIGARVVRWDQDPAGLEEGGSESRSVGQTTGCQRGLD